MNCVCDPTGELGISGERCGRGRGLAVRRAAETQPRAAGAGEPRDAAGDADQELRTRGKERPGGREMCHLARVRRSQDTQPSVSAALCAVQIESKQLHSNKQENNRISDANFIKYKTKLSSSSTEDKSVIILIINTVTILTVS